MEGGREGGREGGGGERRDATANVSRLAVTAG